MKKCVAVMFGGKSSEHDISIITGLQVLNAVDKNLYDVLPLYISRDGKWYTGDPLKTAKNYSLEVLKQKNVFEVALLPSSNCLFKKNKNKLKEWLKLDCIILAMHGMNGEDGTIQGLLELSGIPYTSSGVVSSGVCMDKVLMKRLFESLKLPVLPWFYVTREEVIKNLEKVNEKIEKLFGYPVIIKPANLGSSIGIGVCNNLDELKNALIVAGEYDYKLIIEKCVTELKEVNCSVLGFRENIVTATLEEPVNYKEFLTFDDKYNKPSKIGGMANLSRILPANISKIKARKIVEYAKRAFYELECAGVVRIDFIIDKKQNKIYINEINTIPGSFAFYLWEYDKVEFKVLINKLISFAFEKSEEKCKNKYTYSSNVLLHFGEGAKNRKSK